jgi:hypothetical protein
LILLELRYFLIVNFERAFFAMQKNARSNISGKFQYQAPLLHLKLGVYAWQALFSFIFSHIFPSGETTARVFSAS